MSTLKVDTLKNGSSGAIDFPQNIKIGGNGVIQGYTSSASEPSSPATGDYWWDSNNEKLYRYINGEFKELTLGSTAVIWGGTRGFLIGGQTNSGYSNVIQYFDITTPGNGTDFGDLTSASQHGGSASNQSRIVHRKGITSGSGWPGNQNTDIDYFASATTGNATDFGDSTVYVARHAAVGNGTRGIFGAGYGASSTSGTWSQAGPNVVEYVTIANTGNATDFGDLSAGGNGLGATNDETRGWCPR